MNSIDGEQYEIHEDSYGNNGQNETPQSGSYELEEARWSLVESEVYFNWVQIAPIYAKKAYI